MIESRKLATETLEEVECLNRSVAKIRCFPFLPPWFKRYHRGEGDTSRLRSTVERKSRRELSIWLRQSHTRAERTEHTRAACVLPQSFRAAFACHLALGPRPRGCGIGASYINSHDDHPQRFPQANFPQTSLYGACFSGCGELTFKANYQGF